jgi:RNA methyltransferase, TrmH family
MCTLARLTKPGFFMLSRRQIQFITSLQQKKFRKEHQCFIAEGSKLLEELLQSRLVFDFVYATKEWIHKNHALLEDNKTEALAISEKELNRISTLKTANQALAVLQIPSPTFDPGIAANQPMLMLDNISDPGNLGTILRTADWFGIHHVVCSPDTVDLYNPKTVQATMGSIGRMHVYYLDLKDTLAGLEPDVPVYGSMLQGKPITDIEPSKNGIIIIGNEAHGISGNILPYITHPVLIPAHISGGAGTQRPESLNAAVAAAILCWEFKRKLLL